MLFVFAIVTLLYPMGCGPPCGGVEFDYSEEDMRQHLEPLAGMVQQYSASNQGGVLDVTFALDQSTLVQSRLTPSDTRTRPGWSLVRTANACSVPSGQQIFVDGTLTATFTPNGGDEQLLVSDRAIRAEFRVDGYEEIDNGTIRMLYAEDLSFELESETGEIDAFELTQFWSQGNGAATIGYAR
jgi:hypothetical protein